MRYELILLDQDDGCFDVELSKLPGCMADLGTYSDRAASSPVSGPFSQPKGKLAYASSCSAMIAQVVDNKPGPRGWTQSRQREAFAQRGGGSTSVSITEDVRKYASERDFAKKRTSAHADSKMLLEKSAKARRTNPLLQAYGF